MYLVQNRNEVMRAIRPCIHRIPILYVLRLRASFYSMQTAIFLLLLFLFCLFFAMIHSCKFMNGIWWWKQSWRSRAATTTRITHGKSRYIQHVCLKDETLCEQCAKTLNICMGECLCLTLANQQQCSSRKKVVQFDRLVCAFSHAMEIVNAPARIVSIRPLPRGSSSLPMAMIKKVLFDSPTSTSHGKHIQFKVRSYIIIANDYHATSNLSEHRVRSINGRKTYHLVVFARARQTIR